MFALGVSGSTHDFFCFDTSNNVYNGASFVSWSDGSYASYRITATEIGTSGDFTGAAPSGAIRFDLRLRGASLAASPVVYSDVVAVQTGDAYAIVNDSSFGNSKLVRSVTPSNALAINSSGRVDLGLWLGSAPDALSSGKLPADVKLWLTSAPATLSTNGYVKSVLLRWLTDDAGGTPDALSSGKIPADLKLWLTVAPLALSSQMVQALVNAYASGQAPLQPTVSGRTLDVAATGEAGLDFDNVKQATGATTLTNIRVPNVTLTDTVTTYSGNTKQTGDAFLRLGSPAGISVSADIAGVQAALSTVLGIIPDEQMPNTHGKLWALNGDGNAIPTASEIDTELSGTHGNGSWEGSDAPTVEEIDTQLSDTHGSGQWGAAGGGGAYNVEIQFSPALEGIKATLLVGITAYHLETDSDGIATQEGSIGGDYILTAAYSGYSLTPMTGNISGDAEIDATLTPVVIPVPGTPGLCSVAVNIIGGDGQPLSGVVVTASIHNKLAAVDAALVSMQVLTATTDESGQGIITGIQRAQFVNDDGWYDFNLPDVGKKRVKLPNTSTATLEEIINPPVP